MTELRKAELSQMGHESALMRELTQSQGWECLLKHLTAYRDDSVDRMLRGTKEGFEYRKGFIEGLEVALGLPKMVMDRYEGTLQER